VATLRIRTDLKNLAEITAAYAYKYNTCLLMVERNNHGHTLLNILDDQMHYPNLYYHQETGSALRHGERRLGWPTRANDTKPMMIQRFKDSFEAGTLEIYDPDCLREISQYRFFDPRLSGVMGGTSRRGSYGPPSAGTDDLLDAHMGCLMGMEYATSGQRAQVEHYGSSALAAGLGAVEPRG
jgi:hypothetical protein